MPYIEQQQRKDLDPIIDDLARALMPTKAENDKDFVEVGGKLNYSVSRLCAQLVDKPSYAKIALITGVLENIKQEFYRRLAAPYEDYKIKVNGDVDAFVK